MRRDRDPSPTSGLPLAGEGRARKSRRRSKLLRVAAGRSGQRDQRTRQRRGVGRRIAWPHVPALRLELLYINA